MKFEALEGEYNVARESGVAVPQSLVREVEVASGLYEQQTKVVDDLALSWNATFRLIEQSLSILRSTFRLDDLQLDSLGDIHERQVRLLPDGVAWRAKCGPEFGLRFRNGAAVRKQLFFAENVWVQCSADELLVEKLEAMGYWRPRCVRPGTLNHAEQQRYLPI